MGKRFGDSLSQKEKKRLNNERNKKAREMTDEDARLLEKELDLLREVYHKDKSLAKNVEDELEQRIRENQAILDAYSTLQCGPRQTPAPNNIPISERIGNIVGSSIMALVQLSCLLHSAMYDKSNTDDDLYKLIVEKIFDSASSKITFATRLPFFDRYQIIWISVVQFPFYCDRGELFDKLRKYYVKTQKEKPVNTSGLWEGKWNSDWTLQSMSDFTERLSGYRKNENVSDDISYANFITCPPKTKDYHASDEEISVFLSMFEIFLKLGGLEYFSQDKLLEALKLRYSARSKNPYCGQYQKMVTMAAYYLVCNRIACTWIFFAEFLLCHMHADDSCLIYKLFELIDMGSLPEERLDVDIHMMEYLHTYLSHLNIYRFNGYPSETPIAITINYDGEMKMMLISIGRSKIGGISVNKPDPKDLCFIHYDNEFDDRNFDGYPHRNAKFGYDEKISLPGLPWCGKDGRLIPGVFDFVETLSGPEKLDPFAHAFAYGFDARFFRLFPFRYFPFVEHISTVMTIYQWELGKIKRDRNYSATISILPIEVMYIIFDFLTL
jgi:hypothetical protein